mgnify:CR=1 FL=1
MFSSARLRLTLWFAGVLALMLVAMGSAIYLSTRHALLSNLDADLRSRASKEVVALVARLSEASRRQLPLEQVRVGPEHPSAPYFYALLRPNAQVLSASANTDPAALPPPEATTQAVEGEPLFVNTRDQLGEQMRVYLLPMAGPRGSYVLAVGRSREPEMEALQRLLLVLIGGGAGGLVLASAGGYFLAGRALRPIREALERQRAFVADASHELRTPLALIRASAELLRRHPEEPIAAQQQAVNDIVAESERLTRLVGQLLVLARADAGRLVLNREHLDLTAVARDVVRQLGPQAEARGLALTCQADGPVYVRGDEARLREVLLILLDNALKFTGQGGQVTVRVSEASGRARLTVSDTGVGIAPEHLPRIFDRFYRVERTGSQDGGAGLGLAIAKSIVEAHEGHIWAESQPGRGSSFHVELPRSNPRRLPPADI